ncbi:hydrogen peroxide-inducible genes activator [Mesorhizobium sp. CGMCC 1.15528]|uniref:Hydrogen peroxide-inducible genes activator n=1 Tax=Mesorhizobium zhangyense TaxID=1776730 RepID=A0A7C9R7S3_9HYPH|nr:hydrogen peroxide-inducible genes activator [Mesorhizobium zhangyense]NGN40393.1 hydrogen peroxide-inducible genes activator [Mesorhizobium zhangyense]
MIRLTVRQMQYFDALAQTLHFGRAAELAGVTQPALSAQIAELEERLGCRLFERGGKSVRMTEEAQVLLPRIETILADIREVETIARRGRLSMEGRFRLGIIPTIAPYLLPHVLPELKSRFPALQLELREAVTASLIEETAAGRLDGFIAALPLDFPGLVKEELFQDRFFLAVAENDPGFIAPPVAPDSPALERLMLLEEGHCLREQALAVCGNVKPVAMASYGATSLTTLLQMVAHGLGVTLIPEMATGPASAVRDLKIVPFMEPMPSRTVCLAWRRNSQRHEECVELAKIVRGLREVVLPQAA